MENCSFSVLYAYLCAFHTDTPDSLGRVVTVVAAAAVARNGQKNESYLGNHLA